MTQEEKAKAYDELKVKAQELEEDGCFDKITLFDLFPELKESEDERIRKALMQNLKERFGTKGSMGEGLDMPDVFAWLEKQGEQKPADKIEQKFEIGDLITNSILVGKIDEIHEFCYHAYFGDHYADVPDVENWHKWTIKDAKDGDVLADGNLPFIFKKIDANKYSYAYCGISVDGSFKIDSDGESGEWTWMQDIKPANNEQRDLLFQKMHEAGYDWDAEKKELKKIEQKSAWSEEDEESLLDLIKFIENWKAKGKNFTSKLALWTSNEQKCDRLLTFLKSLRPQNTWKPSEKQLKALQGVYDWYMSHYPQNKEFESLFDDLLKL